MGGYFADKIRNYREIKGLSQSDVAKKIGISRVVYGKYERAETEPGIEKLSRLAELFGVTPNDLILDGDSISQVNEDDQLLYRQRVNVELVNLKVNAGYGVASQEREVVMQQHWPILPATTNSGRKWVVFEVDGDSMAPTINHGDYICCDKASELYFPGVYMMRLSDGSFACKQVEKVMDRKSEHFGKFHLKSHNRIYGSQYVSEEYVEQAWRVVQVVHIKRL